MFLPDLVLRSQRVVTAEGMRPAAIHIRRGRIIGVLGFDEVLPDAPLETVESVVMPGIVDTHVHLGDAFENVTRRAAAAGVTTIATMPFPGKHPITSVTALERTREEASGRCFVDVGFWGGVVPGNLHSLEPLFEAGVLGFKCVLSRNAGLAVVAESDLRRAMPVLTSLDAVLLAHAEPATLVIALASELATRVHLVHLSSAEELTPLFRAQAARVRITAETSPDFLCLVAGERAGRLSDCVCAPPLRERANREYLWASLGTGLIRMVASSGPSALAALWKEARTRGHRLEQLADWLCRAPARLAGLTRKGIIDVGYDADLVVFDPDAGVVERTFVRGAEAHSRTGGFGSPRGRLITRGAN